MALGDAPFPLWERGQSTSQGQGSELRFLRAQGPGGAEGSCAYSRSDPFAPDSLEASSSSPDRAGFRPQHYERLVQGAQLASPFLISLVSKSLLLKTKKAVSMSWSGGACGPICNL